MKKSLLTVLLISFGMVGLSSQNLETDISSKRIDKLNEFRAGVSGSGGGVFSMSYERFISKEFSAGVRTRFLSVEELDSEIEYQEKINISFVGRYYLNDVFRSKKNFNFYMEGTVGYSNLEEQVTKRTLNSEGNFVIRRDIDSIDGAVLSYGLGMKILMSDKFTIDTGFGLGRYLGDKLPYGYGFINLELGYRF